MRLKWDWIKNLSPGRFRTRPSAAERQLALEKAFARLAREQAKANLLWEQSLQEHRVAISALDKQVEERLRTQLTDHILPDLLNFIDDLYQAIYAIEQQSSTNPSLAEWVHGLRVIHAHSEELLSFWDIKPFIALGQPFNPALHRPVEVVIHPDLPQPTVVAEVQRGYMQGTHLYRYATVIVARAESVNP